MTNLRLKLLKLLKKHAFKRGNFMLSSGKRASFYIDARAVTLSAEGAYLTSSVILGLIKSIKAEAIGGPMIGADPIAGAIAALSFVEGRPIKAFIVRKQPKAHGRMKQIESPDLKKGARVILIDDVATTGKSIVEAARVLRKSGLKVDEAIVLIDRKQGARDALKGIGCRLTSIFTIEDFINKPLLPY